MAWIDKLVGKSPIKPMQEHMKAALACARELVPLMEIMAAGDDEALREKPRTSPSWQTSGACTCRLIWWSR
jgi:hypothetical protein